MRLESCSNNELAHEVRSVQVPYGASLQVDEKNALKEHKITGNVTQFDIAWLVFYKPADEL